MWRSLLKTILLLPVVLVAWLTLVRIIRRFYKFPISQFLANLIDNSRHGNRKEMHHENPGLWRWPLG